MKSVIIICLALALIAAIIYFLTGASIITVPTLNSEDAPAAIAYVAGGCYVLGGLLILVRKSWLWTVGLVINTLVVAFFFIMYNQKHDIMLSLPGLGTKIAQVLLEAGLFYLVAASRRKPQPAELRQQGV